MSIAIPDWFARCISSKRYARAAAADVRQQYYYKRIRELTLASMDSWIINNYTRHLSWQPDYFPLQKKDPWFVGRYPWLHHKGENIQKQNWPRYFRPSRKYVIGRAVGKSWSSRTAIEDSCDDTTWAQTPDNKHQTNLSLTAAGDVFSEMWNQKRPALMWGGIPIHNIKGSVI